MKRFHLALFAFVALASIGCDQATKRIAVEILDGAPVYSFVADSIRFELVENPGAFLSLGARLPEWVRDVVFLGLVPVLLGVVCFALLRSGFNRGHQVVGLAMMAGGGLGNWIDRLLQDGAVTDFVSLGLGSLRTGIFNVADLAVVAGVALVLFERLPWSPAPVEAEAESESDTP